jgi:hypothetical protein
MNRSVLLAAGAGDSAGALGFLVVLVLLAATALLIRNMNSRLKRLPKEFDNAPPTDTDDPDDDPDSLAG